MAVRALLLDFDGTMVDTESVDWRSWEEVFAQHGVEVPRERFLLRIGTLNGPDELDELDALLETPVDREAVQAARRARERELIADEPLRPGVDRLLEEAAELGLKVAIVSSSTRDWVQSHLERLAIEHHVAFVHCADGDRDRCKPSPVLYLEALEQLGVARGRGDRARGLHERRRGREGRRDLHGRLPEPGHERLRPLRRRPGRALARGRAAAVAARARRRVTALSDLAVRG